MMRAAARSPTSSSRFHERSGVGGPAAIGTAGAVRRIPEPRPRLIDRRAAPRGRRGGANSRPNEPIVVDDVAARQRDVEELLIRLAAGRNLLANELQPTLLDVVCRPPVHDHVLRKLGMPLVVLERSCGANDDSVTVRLDDPAIARGLVPQTSRTRLLSTAIRARVQTVCRAERAPSRIVGVGRLRLTRVRSGRRWVRRRGAVATTSGRRPRRR